MNFLVKLRELRKEYFTFVIIPHSGKGTQQIKLNKVMLYTILGMSSILCISLVIMVISLANTNYALHTSLDNVSQLEQLSNQQKQEINDLRNRTSTINQKLTALSELEEKVRSMVGLKIPTENASPSTTSRSFDRSAYGTDADELTSDALDGNLDVLAAEMDSKIDNFSELITDVDDQLKILDARPDLVPTKGKVTSKFGYRVSPFTGKRQFHQGIDIANDKGTPVYAAGTGIVTFSGWNAGYGKTIIVSHGNGYRSVYAHNNENLVEAGKKVKKGDIIAKMGSTGKSTGPHLHFEIHSKGAQINPENILIRK
jgi:murein DD-endopeptidase MepM/ murein hydrolase activator NlpD